MRFAGPLWRVTGSVVSWALFTFCFTLLLLGAITVMGLGGYCASGGAYVIEIECPEAVAVTMPLSIFGGLAAVAIGVIFARGFGVPVVAWAWPILFVGPRCRVPDRRRPRLRARRDHVRDHRRAVRGHGARARSCSACGLLRASSSSGVTNALGRAVRRHRQRERSFVPIRIRASHSSPRASWCRPRWTGWRASCCSW